MYLFTNLFGLFILDETASGHTLTGRSQSHTLFAEEDKRPLGYRTVERGVSVDQDGKSNVWAIEPKVEVDSKSSEEQGQLALFAGGGLAATIVLAAGILANLPDPNQF